MAVASGKATEPCTIPASPNWYCSGSANCNDSGHYVFVARSSVYLINLKDSFPVCKDIIQFKRERVTSVCLLNDNDDKEYDNGQIILAVGLEEHCVKIWHEDMRKIIKEHKLHQAKVNVIVSHESKCITSGDDRGLMVTWNYENDNSSSWMPIPSNILSMASCPHSKWLTAIGYGNGHILVCNVKKQEIIQHFKSHIDEVHSVVWCPSSQFQLTKAKEETKEENKGYLLASGSKDKTIKVWDTTKDYYLLSLTLPTRTSVQKGRKKFEDATRAKIWMALCWCKRDSIISSSLSGEMLVWDLNTKDWSCIAPAHNRVIFNISCDFESGKLVTTSMDRQIMLWKLDTYEFLHSIPTLGGFVYSLSASVLDPNCIIYGVGDNLIRFWNTRSDERPYETNILWQGIKSKVTVIACHRTKESVIGFATDDGHVGVYNIRSGKFEVSASYHKKTVYSLSWGPSCQNNDSDRVSEGNSLFSCGGEGLVLIHSIHDLQSKARDMNAVIKKTNQFKEKMPSRSDIEWKADLTFVAVGNDDGSIEIFAAPNLYRVCLIQVHKKIINCMKWHHEFDSLHGQPGTKHSSLLASGSSDNYVCVTDLTHTLDNEDFKSKMIVIKDKFRYFNSHSQRITDLSWNPHTSGMLASSSFDGSVQIWNVISNELIANFRDHMGKVLCVMWSFVDRDVIYSGGEDFTLRRWVVSQCEFKTPPGNKKQTAQLQKSLKANQTSKTDQGGGNKIDNPTNDDSLLKNQVNSSGAVELKQRIQSTSFVEIGDVSTETVIQNGIQEISPKCLEKPNTESVSKKTRTKDRDAKKKKPKSLFPLFSTFNHKQKASSQQECVLLAQHLTGHSNLPDNAKEIVPGKGDHVNLGLFADKLSTFKMFNEEGINHDKLGNLEQQLHLELWKGNLGGAFEICQKTGELNEMLVAMSPLGGFDFWQSTMQTYAEQLASNCDFYSAATYYIAADNVQGAIDMFKKQNMFKEAIAVAKIRLPSSDPILLDLYRIWGDKLSTDGCFEHAAKCYLASGCYEDAINILSKKGDISSLKTAAQVATICGQAKMAEDLTMQTVDSLLLEMKFSELAQLLSPLDRYKELFLLTIVHECFVSSILSTEADIKLEMSSNITANGWMNRKNVSTTTFTNLKDLGIPTKTKHSMKLVDLVCCLYYEEFEEIIDMNVLKSKIPSLPKQCLSKTLNGTNDFKKLLLQVSRQLMYGMLYLLEDNMIGCFKWWLHTIEICYSTHQFDIVERLYAILFPRDNVSVEEYRTYSSNAHDDASDIDISNLFRNFSAFYYTALLYIFWWGRFATMIASEDDNILQNVDVNIDCCQCGEIPLCDKDCVLLLEEHVQRLSNHLELKFQCKNVHLHQLGQLLPCLAANLVSNLHARASQLKNKISDIDQKVMEAKIRKQLRQHIKQRSEEQKKKDKVKDKKNSVSYCKESSTSSEDQNWRLRNTDQVTNNEERKKSVSSETEIFGHDLDIMDDQSILQLTDESLLLKRELDLLPAYIKDYPFPDSIENAKILVFIATRCIEASCLDLPTKSKLESLAKNITECCLNCCLAEVDRKHFNIKKQRLSEIR